MPLILRISKNDKKIRPVLMVSALTGSEKQVRWAESIRREKMAAAREWLARHPGEQADKCLAWYGGHASASWWIDHRDERPQRTAKLGVAEWLK